MENDGCLHAAMPNAKDVSDFTMLFPLVDPRDHRVNGPLNTLSAIKKSQVRAVSRVSAGAWPASTADHTQEPLE